VLSIQRNPHFHSPVIDKFRRAFVRRFPFEIFYEPTDDAIIVYPVFHFSKDPQEWRKRLGYDG